MNATEQVDSGIYWGSVGPQEDVVCLFLRPSETTGPEIMVQSASLSTIRAWCPATCVSILVSDVGNVTSFCPHCIHPCSPALKLLL